MSEERIERGLQYVKVCNSTACFSVLQCVAVLPMCTVELRKKAGPKCVAVSYRVLQCVAACCRVLQCVALSPMCIME